MTPPDANEGPDAAALLAALPVAVVVVDPADRVARVNTLAEELLDRSERVMHGRPLASVLPLGAVACEGAVIGRTRVDVAVAPVPGHPGWRAVTLHPHAADLAPDRTGGARAAIGAAAMLAHEIRNPLSGIRGAAQLIGAGSGGAGELTDLITREVDRIAALIDRMQAFGDERPLPLSSENIYPLIDHARRLALAGFAAGIAIEERFDPSLPPATINPDALLQILINLLKNASQALGNTADPRIVVATAYRHGIAVREADGGKRALPIEIAVIDNGPGPPTEIADHLFDPFVSGRPEGEGLGLALVDKLARDMGGIVRHGREGSPAMTVFRLHLPRGAA